MQLEDDGEAMEQGENGALGRPAIDEIGGEFAGFAEGAPGEGAAGCGGQPADFEGFFQPIIGGEFLVAGTLRLHIGDKQNDLVTELCECLTDFHDLNAVGVWRRDARHGDSEDFHFYIAEISVMSNCNRR